MHVTDSEFLDRLKKGDSDAVQCFYVEYIDRLLKVTKYRIGLPLSPIVDPEDIVQDVFWDFFRGITSGQFSHIQSLDDAWWLLLAIAKCSAVDHVRREAAKKRGYGRVNTEANLGPSIPDSKQAFSLDHLIGQEPTPDFLVALDEELQRLMGLLRDDGLRHIANARIKGYTVSEIAEELGISTRSVERKLQLIRSKFGEELESQSHGVSGKLINKVPRS